MLDDQLTLLDGTDVITVGALIQITGRTRRDVEAALIELRPETALGGVRYFSRDKALLALEVRR